ncbi:MAG: large-conductance mechanosensitive channel protein MscL [bacterium]
MFKEFKEFITGGSVVDMAVGIIIGAAFGGLVTSFVADILMPPIGMLLGGVDFSNLFTVIKEGELAGPYPTLELAAKAGAVTINWGNFINTLTSFIIVAFAIFLVVKAVNKTRKQEEEKVESSTEEKLLTEMRDLMRAQVKIGAATYKYTVGRD